MAQTMHLASFGPVVIVSLPSGGSGGGGGGGGVNVGGERIRNCSKFISNSESRDLVFVMLK
jgi:hypothetical protein